MPKATHFHTSPQFQPKFGGVSFWSRPVNVGVWREKKAQANQPWNYFISIPGWVRFNVLSHSTQFLLFSGTIFVAGQMTQTAVIPSIATYVTNNSSMSRTDRRMICCSNTMRCTESRGNMETILTVIISNKKDKLNYHISNSTNQYQRQWIDQTVLSQYADINFLSAVFFLILKCTTLPSWPVTFRLMCSSDCNTSHSRNKLLISFRHPMWTGYFKLYCITPC